LIYYYKKESKFYQEKSILYNKLMNDSQIICSTCVNSHKILPDKVWKNYNELKMSDDNNTYDFNYRCIIDESSQAFEPATLIPILGAK
jgi:hypothetical protein